MSSFDPNFGLEFISFRIVYGIRMAHTLLGFAWNQLYVTASHSTVIGTMQVRKLLTQFMAEIQCQIFPKKCPTCNHSFAIIMNEDF